MKLTLTVFYMAFSISDIAPHNTNALVNLGKKCAPKWIISICIYKLAVFHSNAPCCLICIVPDDIVVHDCKINYGYKDKNPVDQTRYFPNRMMSLA